MEINFKIKFSYNITPKDIKEIKEHIIDFIYQSNNKESFYKTVDDISDDFIRDQLIKFLEGCDSSEIFNLDGIGLDEYFNYINFDFSEDAATDFISFCAESFMEEA